MKIFLDLQKHLLHKQPQPNGHPASLQLPLSKLATSALVWVGMIRNKKASQTAGPFFLYCVGLRFERQHLLHPFGLLRSAEFRLHLIGSQLLADTWRAGCVLPSLGCR